MPSSDNRLELLLLGQPVIRLHGQGLAEAPPLKSQGILFYLAVTGKPATRDALAALFWNEMPETTARTNLRLALSRLRKVIGECLVLDRQQVALDSAQAPWIDAEIFVQTLHAGNAQPPDLLRAATNLYRGAFLEGFSTPDAPDFERWIVTEREWFHQLMLSGLQEILAVDRAAGRDADAINVARRILEVAPWCEEAHQDLMEMLARTGQRSAALAQYETCRRLLDEELGVLPSAKTVALRAMIASDTLTDGGVFHADGNLTTPATDSTPRRARSLHIRNAPNFPDMLIGRDGAIAEIQTLLDDPACRLLTLVGPGGIGKTRLALAASRPRMARYAHGACFVALAGLKPARQEAAADLVINAIANALDYTFDAQQDPRSILLNHLGDKNLLLICDNFEHLQPAAELLEAIVLAAPGVQLLVTSRERLGARHEWLYGVEGLTVAPGVAASASGLFPADALFIRCAKRINSDFEPVTEAESINLICQALEGWPLSIELAANWLRLLPCSAIAARLHDDAMLLDAATGAPEDRHHSMRVVLDASWALLSADEQRVCADAACFQDGFELDAAQAVLHGGLVQLGSLVDKSFLRRDVTGRYQMHEQVRQFAAARLAQDRAAATAVMRRHAIYFAAFAAAHRAPPGAVPNSETISLFDRDLDNLRSAVAHTIGDDDSERVTALLEGLVPYLRYKGWNREIAATMAQASSLRSAPLSLLARWKRWWAEALYQVGDFGASLQKVEELMAQLGRPLPTTSGSRSRFLLRESVVQVVHRTFPGLMFGRESSQRATLVEAALALERYGLIASFAGNTAIHVVGASINWLERAGAVESLAGSYSLLAFLLMRLGADRTASIYYLLAMKYLNRDLNIAHHSFALEMCGFYCFCRGDWASMQKHIDEGIVLAIQSARRRTGLELQLLVAISLGVRSRFEAAIARAAAVLLTAQVYGDTILQAWSLMIQVEYCLHADADLGLRLLSLVAQLKALPSDEISRTEHFGIHISLAVIAQRTGHVSATYELDLAQALSDSLEMPNSGAFESYANLFEVAFELATSPNTTPEERQSRYQRVAIACTTMRKFARTHRFARPRSLIFDGLQQWQQGRHRKASQMWQQAAAVAEEYAMRYDIARAHFEIGRHLAAQETWDGHAAAYYLEQARADFTEIGAGYMLARMEQIRDPVWQVAAAEAPKPIAI